MIGRLGSPLKKYPSAMGLWPINPRYPRAGVAIPLPDTAFYRIFQPGRTPPAWPDTPSPRGP
jgi:hypothetical protein